MAVQNLYITLADFLSWQRSTSTDTADDAVILAMIEQASRQIDQLTGRRFYPTTETHVFDIPMVDYTDRDTIYLDDDLLALTTFTNGDASVIASSDYILRSPNVTPYWAIKLRDTATVGWEQNTAGSSEQVLSVLGIWGWHDRYAYAWKQVGTLGAAITDTTTKTVTLTAGHTTATGQIWKVDNEVFQGSVSTNTLTLNFRGDNGTTAATHSNGAAIYMWQVAAPIFAACQIVVNDYYDRRFGSGQGGVATITAAGVVITPNDFPASAYKALRPLMRQS